MASDSPRAMTPRTSGRRRRRCRAIGEEISRVSWAISPSGFRTATAQFEGPRIMTPSRTACPPIEAATFWLAPAGAFEAPLEALHPSTGVEQLLLPGVEGMTGGADLDVEVGLR